MSEQILFQPIGVIHSPFSDLAEMPIQPVSENSAAGTVEIFPQFAEGLRDLDGFSHIYLITYLHKVSETRLTVTPFLDDEPRGLFATRAPCRPNPIGLSLVKLLRVEGRFLHVANLDMLEGTPLLDIKPYVAGFETTGGVRSGWLEDAGGKLRARKSDGRFQ